MDNRRSNQSYRKPGHHSNQNQRSHSGGGGGGRRDGHSSHHRHSHSRGGPLQEVVTHASRRLSNHSALGLFILAFLAGGLVTLGALFGITLAQGASDPVLRSLLVSAGVATGLFILVGINAALFTEPNVIMPTNFYNRSVKQGFLAILQFWGITWVGNFLGAIAFGWFIPCAHTVSAQSLAVLTDIVNHQLLGNVAGASVSFWQALLSGVLANWALGFALIYSVYNRAAVGKIFILLFTTALVVTTSLQFYPLNLSYFSLLTFAGSSSASWSSIVINNLLPVSIGNLLGGAFLVALPLLFQTRRTRSRSS